ncbi:testicular acid phosphatase homolog [Coccinella septempunctata]|uniref:testicular acid phosphatase homolog n=1 Tax=Coccinella septempunctata TaxID=41139 RepID=UPI001D080A6E|nr:testicular acid phosphatase homolog [Coccinella septempunctata]
MTNFWILFVIFSIVVYAESYKGELLASVVIFREGQRTPLKEFSQDPWKSDWESIGYGQLSKSGKKQMYELGKWIRERYAEHLPPVYTKNSIHVQAIDFDEAITSAYMVLAGLYPPVDNQTNDVADQQLIPVHTEKISNDFLFMGAACKQFPASTTTSSFRESEYTDRDRLEERLGMKFDPNITLLDVFDTISAARAMNLDKKPSWSDVNFMNVIENNIFNQLAESTSTLDQAKIKIGPLIYEITEYMNQFIPGPPKNVYKPKFKAVFYAAVLDTMISLINGLQTAEVLVLPDHIPEFGSSIMFELREGYLGHKYINIFYKNSTDDLAQIKIKDCSLDCDYQIFLKKVQPLIHEHETAVAECEDGPYEEPQSLEDKYYGVILPFGL